MAQVFFYLSYKDFKIPELNKDTDRVVIPGQKKLSPPRPDFSFNNNLYNFVTYTNELSKVRTIQGRTVEIDIMRKGISISTDIKVQKDLAYMINCSNNISTNNVSYLFYVKTASGVFDKLHDDSKPGFDIVFESRCVSLSNKDIDDLIKSLKTQKFTQSEIVCVESVFLRSTLPISDANFLNALKFVVHHYGSPKK